MNTISDRKRFGCLMRDWRKVGRWTQREAADRIGISNPYLCQMERGERNIPSFSALIKISNGYDIPLHLVMRAAGMELPSINPFADAVAAELCAARSGNPRLHSTLEALGLIRQEYVEFEQEVFRNPPLRNPDAIRRELVQLAAMCQRAAEDCLPLPATETEPDWPSVRVTAGAAYVRPAFYAEEDE